MAVKLARAKIAESLVPFPDGIALTMRTATSVDVEDAETEAGEVIASLVAGHAGLADFGLEGIENPLGNDAEGALGFAAFLTLALVFQRVVSGWEGVQTEDGAEAPLSKLYIGLFLLDPVYRSHFRATAYRRLYAEAQEGNA